MYSWRSQLMLSDTFMHGSRYSIVVTSISMYTLTKVLSRPIQFQDKEYKEEICNSKESVTKFKYLCFKTKSETAEDRGERKPT